jgi:hypothetical protein
MNSHKNHISAHECQCDPIIGECHCAHAHGHSHNASKAGWKQYRLLLIALIGITLFASGMVVTSGFFELHYFMQYFMAGYFLVFGAMQAISLKKSAKMFQQYDVIARKVPLYGYAYPFIELALGLAYLFWLSPIITNLVAATVLFFTVIGVIGVMEQKKKVRCGCLGNAMNVSVGWVTLVENAGMFIMAFGMLIYFFATYTPNGSVEPSTNRQHRHRSL